MKPVILIVSIAALWLAPFSEGAVTPELMAAADLISRTEGPATREEMAALALLRQYPNEMEELVLSGCSKGGWGPERAGRLLQFVPESERLRIKRTVFATYDIKDSFIPFESDLIFYGEAQDIEILRRRITFEPNSRRSIGYASSGASRDLPQVHAVLLELKDKVPGEWQESFWVRRFFHMKAGDWPPKNPLKLKWDNPPPDPDPITAGAPATGTAVPLTSRNSSTRDEAPQSAESTKVASETAKLPRPAANSEKVATNMTSVFRAGVIAVLAASVLLFLKRFRGKQGKGNSRQY